MDPPTDDDPPCIIQALRASSSTVPAPPLVQALPALQSPAKDHAPSSSSSSSRPPKRQPPQQPAAPPPCPRPPSPRRTRSGGAPEWTPAETLALVAEVAAVDDGWSRSVSAFQKWAMVAENLAASEAFASGLARRGKRAAGECRRRWEALEADYGAVRRWEVRAGLRYWEMSVAARRKAGLPAEFDAEVFGAMDALIRVEEALLANAAGGGGGAGEEVEGLVGGSAVVEVGEEDTGVPEIGEDEVKENELVDEAQEDESANEIEDEDGREDDKEMQPDNGNGDTSNSFEEGCEAEAVETNSKTENSQNIVWELASKLQENAQHIHTILNDEANECGNENHALAYSMSPDAMETTRQKADELIKSLGGLLGYLNQFTELIEESGFENVGMT